MKIRRINDKAFLPQYQTAGSAGADLKACLNEPFIIKPGEITAVPTGLQMEIPQGFEGQIRPRSGLAKKGLTVANAPGTIDSDYRGEVKILLVNLSDIGHEISHGDRVAQIVFQQVNRFKLIESDRLSGTERGGGGFGSTGEK